MKKEKIKKEKKPRLSIKQRIINKITPQVQKAVQEHDYWLIDKICHRIEILACDLEHNYDLEYILEDIKNGGYDLSYNQRSEKL